MLSCILVKIGIIFQQFYFTFSDKTVYSHHFFFLSIFVIVSILLKSSQKLMDQIETNFTGMSHPLITEFEIFLQIQIAHQRQSHDLFGWFWLKNHAVIWKLWICHEPSNSYCRILFNIGPCHLYVKLNIVFSQKLQTSFNPYCKWMIIGINLKISVGTILHHTLNENLTYI